MGDITAMHSITRVIEAHEDELIAEALSDLRAFLGALGVEVAPERIDVLFINDMTQLEVRLIVRGQDGEAVEEGGHPIGITIRRHDIAALADRFPDCDVAW